VSPKTRVLRTICQVMLAVGAAIPAAIALLPLNAEDAAWCIGIAGAFTIIVSAIHNAIDSIK